MPDRSDLRPGPGASLVCSCASALLAAWPGLAFAQEATRSELLATVSMATPGNATPFGALSLFVLGGTLLAGLVVGAGAASLRERARLPRGFARLPAIDPHVQPSPQRRSVSPPGEAPVAALAVVAVLGGAPQPHATSIERWIEEIGEGPRFGPRIVGLVSPRGFAKADAIARIADAAIRIDRDVVLVEAGDSDPGALAQGLDQRIGRAGRPADPFGAGARVEIMPLVDLLPSRSAPSAADWIAGLQGLAARADVVLVDLPEISTLARLPAAASAIDEIVLLHGAEAHEGRRFAQEAARLGVCVGTQIIVRA